MIKLIFTRTMTFIKRETIEFKLVFLVKNLYCLFYKDVLIVAKYTLKTDKLN